MTRVNRHLEDITAAKPTVFWTDREGAPGPYESLVGEHTADLVIVGAGLTGLWAALHATLEQPGRSIVVLDAKAVGFGASTRNGGFCDASLTHGLWNGLRHWPDDYDTLERMGHQNLADMQVQLDALGIDAAVDTAGFLGVADREWQVDDLADEAEILRARGREATLLDASGTRALLDSPTYLAGLRVHGGSVMVDPAQLVWGLATALETQGVRFHEDSRVTSIERQGPTLEVRTEHGSCRAERVIVATNAWAEPVRQIRNWVIPIYDHVLMTEPLSEPQRDSIGWVEPFGVSDSGNQFHYYRLTRDGRILWGGYDANYYAGNGMGPEYENRTASHALLASHFRATFPQLDDVAFSHRWAGPIGTTSKFAATFGTRHDGQLAWVAGYTGLGVGASRWGARVALDLVDGIDSERTDLALVRRKPMPFPPEPFRNTVIQYTRKQIARADENGGQDGRWLRLLSAIGVGFDS